MVSDSWLVVAIRTQSDRWIFKSNIVSECWRVRPRNVAGSTDRSSPILPLVGHRF